MKDKLEPLTLITNVNQPKLGYNYICQICETKHSSELHIVRSICETCANAIRELIKVKSPTNPT